MSTALTPTQARVVGALAEKELTTPQYYPLTLKALVAACNQTSNRDPVMDLSEQQVRDALEALREKGLARLVHPSHGSRSTKYRHVLDEAHSLDRRELALIAVLLLRGAQTVGELRIRTERMATFDSTDDVEDALSQLAQRDDPLVTRLERRPGQKEARWAETLAGAPDVGGATDADERPLVTTRPATPPRRRLPVPDRPRLAPLAEHELDDEQRELLAGIRGGTASNIFTTLVRHPGLFRRWSPFGGKLLNGKLPARDRELLILRTGWRCRAPYEWGQHVTIGRRAGLTDEEIGRIPAGPDAPGWSDRDALLLRAADELHDHAVLSDDTWAALADLYDERQMIEVPMLVGHYHLVAMTLNSLGVPREEGVPGLPERTAERE